MRSRSPVCMQKLQSLQKYTEKKQTGGNGLQVKLQKNSRKRLCAWQERITTFRLTGVSLSQRSVELEAGGAYPARLSLAKPVFPCPWHILTFLWRVRERREGSERFPSQVRLHTEEQSREQKRSLALFFFFPVFFFCVLWKPCLISLGVTLKGG